VGPPSLSRSLRDTSAGLAPRLEHHDKERTGMASNGKKKTTMAKLNREHKVRERRVEKQAKKDARKHQAAMEHVGAPTEPVLTED
jgi:hypothetical protein